MSKEVFKGVRQVNSGTTKFENGYLYLIRTNENGTAGKIYFNGRIYSFDDAELKKIIEDDEEVISMALNDLNKKITDAERQGEEVVTAITSLNTRVSNIESQTGETASQISDLSTRVLDVEGKEASWDAKQDEISDIDEIRSNAANGATAFTAITGLDERVSDIEEYEEVIATSLTDLNTRVSDIEEKKASWDAKQDELVSGTNIKTINGETLLGSGNITIQGGGSEYSAGTNIDITNHVISVTGITQYDDTAIINRMSQLENKSNVWDAKQDAINDLENIRSGAQAGSTAVQPEAISGMATQAWVGSQGYLTGYTETDPVFTSHPASGIKDSDITSWKQAYHKDPNGIPKTDLNNSVQASLDLADTALQVAVTNISTGTGLTGGPITTTGTIGLATTIAGSTTVSSVSSIPVTHRAVLATVSENATLSFAALPADGYEVHVIIRNSGSSIISITLPSSGSYVCTSIPTIYIGPEKYGEVNILNIGGTGFVHGMDSI